MILEFRSNKPSIKDDIDTAMSKAVIDLMLRSILLRCRRESVQAIKLVSRFARLTSTPCNSPHVYRRLRFSIPFLTVLFEWPDSILASSKS